jgi:hypothetical protein
MKRFIFLLLLLFGSFVGVIDQKVLADESGVLMAGYCTDESGVRLPCYWQGNKLFTLATPEGKGGIVYAVGRMGEEIYAAGFYYGDGGLKKPCYWKNGVCVQLPVVDPTKSSEVRALYIKDRELLLSGFCGHPLYGTQACLWINGDISPVNPVKIGNVSQSFTLTMDKGDTYSSGHLVRGTDYILLPCYWKNQTYHSLPVINPPFEYGTAESMVISGSNLYFAGYVNTFAEPSRPCYWRNEQIFELPVLDQSRGGYAFAMTLCQDDLIIVGFCPDKKGIARPCYWRNEEIATLPTLLDRGEGWAKAVGVQGEEQLYIVGYCRNALNGTMPCYWRDGKRYDLPAVDPHEEAAVLAVNL